MWNSGLQQWEVGLSRTTEKKQLKISSQAIIREKINYLCYTQSKFNYPKIKRILLSDYLGQLTKKKIKNLFTRYNKEK